MKLFAMAMVLGMVGTSFGAGETPAAATAKAPDKPMCECCQMMMKMMGGKEMGMMSDKKAAPASTTPAPGTPATPEDHSAHH